MFSVFAGRANGAGTLVRRKIGRRRSLEISKRGSALPAFLRDKSGAPGEFLVGALNRYDGRTPDNLSRATDAVQYRVGKEKEDGIACATLLSPVPNYLLGYILKVAIPLPEFVERR